VSLCHGRPGNIAAAECRDKNGCVTFGSFFGVAVHAKQRRRHAGTLHFQKLDVRTAVVAGREGGRRCAMVVFRAFVQDFPSPSRIR